METVIPNKKTEVLDPKGEAPVVIEHLKKSFGKNEILRDINLTINKGENIVVLGKSGTGKSVLIKCIVGLITPDSGTLRILGKNIPDLDIEALDEVRKKVGFLFQSAALYDSMSVRDNLEFPLRRHQDFKNDPEKIEKSVKEALENVGLSQAIDKMPSELSGGMRKRLGLARTLIMRPEIMLYDEPTTGLDPVTSKEISNLIVDVKNKYHTTSIIITHDIQCAKIVGDRIVVLKDGVYASEGTYEELEKSEDEFVKSFFI